MARKSRRNTETTTIKATKVTYADRVYHAALYARISSEDERKRECESMENQVKMLRDYVSSCDDISEYELYMDRAVTGTKFDRPEFNRMMADMRTGKFDCVIVKDLSRLGRNYLETGNYLESIFPIFGIRFISITDHYDSLTAKASEDGLIVPLKNLINEAYAKDISKKVKTSLDTMKRQGKYVASFTPYGYKRDPADNHHLVIDEAVSENVIRIFEERAAGKSIDRIAAGLNDDGIPSPGRYAFESGTRKKANFKESLWGSNTVRRILKNRSYIGDTVQGKTEKALYKGIGITNVAEDDYIIVEGTHEAIVSRKLFEEVQGIFKKTGKKRQSEMKSWEPVEKVENLYGDLFVCGECGRKMLLKNGKVKGKRIPYYICAASGSFGKRCSYKSISKRKMDAFMDHFLKQQMDVYLDCRNKIAELNGSVPAVRCRDRMMSEIAEMERKAEKITNRSRKLYGDFADGMISEEDYLFAKKTYQDELEIIRDQIDKKHAAAQHFDKNYGGDPEMAEAYGRNSDFGVLSAKVVCDLVGRISFYGKNRFEIKMRYEDELMDFIGEAEERCRDEK